VDTANLFDVQRESSRAGVHIVIHRPATVLTTEDAMLLAAWLVVASGNYDDFERVLQAVRSR